MYDDHYYVIIILGKIFIYLYMCRCMHARGQLLGVSSLHLVGSRDEIRP